MLKRSLSHNSDDSDACGGRDDAYDGANDDDVGGGGNNDACGNSDAYVDVYSNRAFCNVVCDNASCSSDAFSRMGTYVPFSKTDICSLLLGRDTCRFRTSQSYTLHLHTSLHEKQAQQRMWHS